MNVYRILTLALLIPGATMIPTSASAQANTFNANQAGRAQSVQMGTVYAVRDVTLQNEGTRTGARTGAALGGIAGSTLGSGSRANTAGALLSRPSPSRASNANTGCNSSPPSTSQRPKDVSR